MTEKTTYALLIYRSGDSELSQENDELALVSHRALQKEAASRGELHAVAQLEGVSTAKSVFLRGNAHDLTDGPYIDTKEWLIGFYLIDCDTQEEALARARTICPIRHHAIEVRPVRWRWRP